MFSSLKLGRFFGIDVFIHPTFWLLPLIVVISTAMNFGPQQALMDVAVLFAVFGCVALHEFGHALAAKAYGIRTRDITLYPIGGVARLENIPEQPWPEIVIAIAGPAVNVVIAIGITALLMIEGIGFAAGVKAGLHPDEFWARLLVANIGLVIFNLIPAFPMDGGRIFRAVMNWFTDRVTATEIASLVGTIFAVLMALVGIVSSEFMLVILAVFVFLTGRGELMMVRHQAEHRKRRHYLRGNEAWDGIPVVRPVAQSPNQGWIFDPVSRCWTEWRNGIPVRQVRAE